MRTIARIFVRDLKRISRNPVAIVITIGVCIIPSLYAWTNIIANDDPYRNTSTIPIAVVIADEGADIPGMGTVNAGSMLRDELAHNDQLGWTFVDSDEEARDGVSAGTYFAAFIIPTDFTAGIADVLTGDTEPAHITYLVNEKANAVAPKVTDTGASTLEEEIAGRFTALVGETVTERLSGAADTGATALDDARAGAASELAESARLLRDLGDGLARAGESVGGARTAVGATRTTMAELSGTATSLADALAGARQHLAQTRTGAQQLTADIAGAVGAASGTVAGISSTAAYDIGALAGDVGWAQGKIDAALAALTGVAGDLQGMRDSLARARDEIAAASVEGAAAAARQDLLDRMDDTVAALDGAIGDLTTNIAALQQVSDHIKAGAESMRGLSATVNGAIQQATASLAGLQADLLTTTLPALSSGLDAFADAGGALTGAAGSVGALIAQADGTLATLDGLLAQGADAVGRTAGAVTTAADDVDSLARDLSLIESARETPVVRDLIALDPATVGAFMGSPVSLVDEAVFPVRNYGSGVAPFYTNLALWVGGFVLVAIYKLEVDEEGIGAVSPWQATLGRGALIAALGQVQALICCTGDIALGMQCVSPAAFIGAGLVASFVYVSIVYALAVAFKHVGKALGVLLVVLQIPGASGLYPIQMQPPFFRALEPWLPFTYGIDAMREAVAGFYGDFYAKNLLMLAVFLLPAAVIGLGMRRRLVPINALFDRSLAATDLMVAEHTIPADTAGALERRLRALIATPAQRAAARERAARFERAYPALVRRGIGALVAAPLACTLLLFVLPAKFALLVCWIVSLVATTTYLLVVAYLHDRAREALAVPESAADPAPNPTAQGGGLS
ncbi:YhgE/Pip family protein [Collinsella intestinalis]|uniref:YhgE/Pip family protein n=1 Tax=Collinsella intestinalis TaxID=147207 RepID=UPI00195BD604|nr:YhgE/Pip domain-containing protein [Collinsella intestinalis]